MHTSEISVLTSVLRSRIGFRPTFERRILHHCYIRSLFIQSGDMLYACWTTIAILVCRWMQINVIGNICPASSQASASLVWESTCDGTPFPMLMNTWIGT